MINKWSRSFFCAIVGEDLVPEQKSEGEASSGGRDREVTVIGATALAAILRLVRRPRCARGTSRSWTHATSVCGSDGGSSCRQGSSTSGPVLPAGPTAWADGRHAAPVKRPSEIDVLLTARFTEKKYFSQLPISTNTWTFVSEPRLVSSCSYKILNCSLTFRWPCIVIYSCNKTNEMHYFLKFIFWIELYMFRTGFLSIISQHNLYDKYQLLWIQY